MKPDWKTVFRVCAGAFLLFLGVRYWTALEGLLRVLLGAAKPLLLGAAVAYVANIPMSFYERHYFPKSGKRAVLKSRRPVCMLAAYLSVGVVAAGVIFLAAPELVSCVGMLIAEASRLLERLTAWAEDTKFFSGPFLEAIRGLDWKDLVSKAVNLFVSGIGGAAVAAVEVVTALVGAVADVVIALVFSIYILASKERLAEQLQRVARRYLRPKWLEKVGYVLPIVNRSFHSYIVGQCTEAVILGALCTAGMLLFRFPYAGVVGVAVGFTALIPVAGAYIGGAVGFLLILTVSPLKAVLFVVYLVILQQLENNLIFPRVVGASMGLPGIWVLTAVIVGGGVSGILGMMLGVPIASAVYQMVKNDVNGGKKAQTPPEPEKIPEKRPEPAAVPKPAARVGPQTGPQRRSRKTKRKN